MSTKLRVFFIRKLIWGLESMFFYPKLSKFYKQFRNSRESTFIIDVGSNRGQSIDFFLTVFPEATIIGMEPNNELFIFLKKKYLKFTNVQLLNKGASDKNGSRNFYINQLDETSSFEKLNYNSDFLKKKANILGVSAEGIIKEEIYVDVIRLSDYIHSKGLTNIFLLKIDVEGHEYSVLKGLFDENNNFKVQHIQLENHEDDMYMNSSFLKIEALLLEKSYCLNKSIKHVFGDFTENIYSLTNEA